MRVEALSIHFGIAVVLAASIITGSALAQVSPQAPGDRKLTTVEGRITKVEWLNPRVALYLDVVDPDSQKISVWVIRTGSPGELETKGILRTRLKAGNVIRAKGTPGPTVNSLDVLVSDILPLTVAGALHDSP